MSAPITEPPAQSARARSDADTGQVSRAFLKGSKNDFRDAEAIAEAVQRPTMRFVATKTAEQLDLQALHRVRSRLVSERTATVNEVRAFLLDRGIAVAQGPAPAAGRTAGHPRHPHRRAIAAPAAHYRGPGC